MNHRALLIFIFFFCSKTLLANSTYGDSVIKHDQTYLLGLVQADLKDDLYFENPTLFSTAVRERISAHVSIDEETTTLLAAKFYEMDTKAPALGFLLKSLFLMLDWSWVEEPFLPAIDDGDRFESSELPLVTQAIRYGYHVFLNKTTWQNILPQHRAALFVYETLFAISMPGQGKNDPTGALFQSASLARFMLGRIFDAKWMGAHTGSDILAIFNRYAAYNFRLKDLIAFGNASSDSLPTLIYATENILEKNAHDTWLQGFICFSVKLTQQPITVHWLSTNGGSETKSEVILAPSLSLLKDLQIFCPRSLRRQSSACQTHLEEFLKNNHTAYSPNWLP
ncbi:MAG: hypothetical protein HY390_02800 [Deltaproteobacteria bacterium]|nr:hypothetical protein [Deltaproteobacteria bacterium]